jgi:hypothetical protein
MGPALVVGTVEPIGEPECVGLVPVWVEIGLLWVPPVVGVPGVVGIVGIVGIVGGKDESVVVGTL